MENESDGFPTRGKPKTTKILKKSEQTAGTRYCKMCDDYLPLDMFNLERKRFLCITHLKRANIDQLYGTIEQKAMNGFRSRSYHDLFIFGQEKLNISKQDIMELWTDEQIKNYKQWRLVPKKPDEMLTRNNAVFVKKEQRRYLISNWKFKKNVNDYIEELEKLVEK